MQEHLLHPRLPPPHLARRPVLVVLAGGPSLRGPAGSRGAALSAHEPAAAAEVLEPEAYAAPLRILARLLIRAHLAEQQTAPVADRAERKAADP